jgi:2'-5' RNA ligase
VELFNRLNNALAAFKKTNNQNVDPNAFLKYGRNRMPSTWSTPEITDEDFYTGIGYAVINKRANRSVTLGKKFLFTDAKEEIIKRANDRGERVIHPYLNLIRDSIDFSERDFWYDISTYLDLEGVYYLMAVRAITPSGKVGNIQYFSLLNPYWVRQVINQKGELGGYVEHNPNKGERIIPKEMIIPIKLLNPFDPSKTYSLADAARDSQFTLKQANDFARESINGNLNAPGILSSAIELPDDQFDNFVARIKGHNRGEPLFGNGSGTVTWTDMQTDLDKAALDKINSINRDVLISVSGLSTSGMGLEQPGTGREVSRTQKDDFTENAIMPQIENIIDALNLDYRRYYTDQYIANKYTIALDNPLETDRDAEQADVEIRDSQFTLVQSLVSKGYTYEIASKYAKGLIDITDLGEPTEEVAPENPTPDTDKTPTGDGDDPNDPKNSLIAKVDNQLAARDIPDLYDDLEIDKRAITDDNYRGCIMINTEIIPVLDHVEDADKDLVEATSSNDHTMGAVSEIEPHATLLYGLLNNGNIWKDKVDSVLKGWSISNVKIEEISYFDLGDSYAIVGLLESTPEIIDGHDRLTLLPHINTFSEYHPHITLAYVKHDEVIRDKWVKALSKQYNNKKINTTDINYGDLPEDDSVDVNSYKNKKFDVYEGYPIPVSQYLNELSDQFKSISEKSSFIYSTESISKTVRIKELTELENSLIGVVDDNTFIKLGEFTQNADKVAILTKLNKRYKNQPVAVKKKINLNHSHEVYTYVKNATFDKQSQLDSSIAQLQASAQAAEQKLYDWYTEQIDNGVQSPHPTSLEEFINSLTLPFSVFFTVMFPIYASYRVQQTAKDLGVADDVPVVVMTDDIKSMINEFARKEATSHINTINTDLQNAIAIINAQTSDLQERQRLFGEAFTQIQQRRSTVIANNAAARIFNISQYEADLQFLTRAGLIKQAYKVLFSMSGDPCEFCASLIAMTNASPVPFAEAFAYMGDEIEADGKKLRLDFENIIAGNVHPNCRCAYRLIIES